MKNILLVDDHELIRQAIPQFLARDQAYHVIQTASNGEQAFAIIQEGGIDLVVTDLSMPVMNGFELIESLKLNFPDLKIIALSMHSNIKTVDKLLNLGANGYLYKNVTNEGFIRALDAVFEGKTHIAPEILSDLKKIKRRDKKEALSTIEKKVISMLINDQSPEEIGIQLGVSELIIEKLITNLKKKSNSQSIQGIIIFAIENGLV